MNRATAFAWFVILLAGAALAATGLAEPELPSAGEFVFWVALLGAAELLAVSLGFGAEVTMAFPIHLALAILYRHAPFVAMSIAGLGALDLREFKREIALHRALFNRALHMLSVGAAIIPLANYQGDPLANFSGAFAVILAALFHLVTDLGLLVVIISLADRVGVYTAFRSFLPRPVAGFAVSYILLTGLGVVTAIADDVGTWAVAAILIPLLFARLSIIGARNQQELAERVQEQQKALLEATERVFKEREDERHRIAAEIHDSTLQALAAASHGSGNTRDFLAAGDVERAKVTLEHTRTALEDAIGALRDSLADLRRSSVEEGGLMESISRFAEQISTLWGAEVKIEGSLTTEPPLPVALAALQIVQEGVTNSVKHADTNSVTIRVQDDNGEVHITVEDRGTGFDPSDDVAEQHVGVRLMRERASRVGGELRLESQHGQGTRVEAILPGGLAQ